MQTTGVVVVTFNSADTIQACLASALAVPRVDQVIVVDNGSTDETLALVRGFGERIELIETGANLGFGRAANLGAARGRSELITLLNPDATTTAATIDLLIAELERGGDRVWAVGPALLDREGRRDYSARGFPTARNGLVNRRWLIAFPRSRNAELRRFLTMDADRETSFDADWLSGAFLVVRRKVFEELGGFDPRFFLYYEEVDLFLRARQRGYAARYVGQAVATHAIGGSSRKVSVKAALWRVQSFHKYHRKHLRKGIADDLRFWGYSALGIALEGLMMVRRVVGGRRD